MRREINQSRAKFELDDAENSIWYQDDILVAQKRGLKDDKQEQSF